MNFSYKGKILISTPVASGNIFSRSVILVIQHDEQGAFGLILNKKNRKMSNRMERVFNTPVEIYKGGPVENDKVFALVKGNPITEDYTKINDNFYLSEDIDTLVAGVMNNNIDISDVKVFSGYSGWSTYQLDEEVKQKLWTVVENNDLDFTTPNDDNLWKNIMRKLGGENLIWANAPKNVSMN